MMSPAKSPSQATPERVTRTIQNRVNPIRGITPERIGQQIDQFNAGQLRELALLMDAVEQRDLFIKGVVSKRKKAAARLPWEILTSDTEDEAAALRHKEALEEAYNRIVATDVLNRNLRGGLRLLLRQLMDAQGKGFSVHEVIWQPKADGTVSAIFQAMPLAWFENTTGTLRFLPEDYAISGQPMDPAGWLVAVGDGLMIPTTVGYMFKRLPERDWLIYCEKFGIPGVLGKTDAAVGSPERTALEEAVGAFINDWAAVCNKSDELTLIEVKGGGALPFEPLVESVERRIAALWRGADLSTLSQGGDSSGASLQGDEATMILEDDAAWLEETLHEGFTKPVIAQLFGAGVEPLAYLKLQTPQRRNIDADDKAVRLCLDAGIPLGVDDTRERLGLAKPDEDEELLEAKAPAGPAQAGPATNPRPSYYAEDQTELDNEGLNADFMAAALDQFAAALATDLAPVRSRLEAVLSIQDPDIFRTRMTALLAELETLKRDIAADPASGEALARIQAAALANGIEAGSQTRISTP